MSWRASRAEPSSYRGETTINPDTKRLVKRVLKTYPMASEKERDDLVRLLHWKGRRAFVVMCVAFLTPEEMETARAKHATITSEGPAKRAARKERRAKRAAEDGSILKLCLSARPDSAQTERGVRPGESVSAPRVLLRLTSPSRSNNDERDEQSVQM